MSAVWGANAMTGVLNVITKRPRDMEGTTVSVGFGGFDRAVKDEDQESGSLLNYQHGSSKLNAFVNALDGGAPALLVTDVDQEPLVFFFTNKTFDVDVSDFRTVGGRHLVSFGAWGCCG